MLNGWELETKSHCEALGLTALAESKLVLGLLLNGEKFNRSAVIL